MVYQNQYQSICRVKAQFDGFAKEYFVNSYGQRVGLLLLQNEKVLMVRQYRFLVNQLAWEIPGGRVDENESPEQAAIREGLEETSYRCRNLKPLLFFHPGLDTFDNPTYLFYTSECEPASAEQLHPNEISDRVWVPLQQCLNMIFTGEIKDSLTIAALLAYDYRQRHPELPT